MTVREIVAEWLRQHGYDGLYNPHNECNCGCNVRELMPDDMTCPAADCTAGVVVACPEDCDYRGLTHFHMGPREGTQCT